MKRSWFVIAAAVLVVLGGTFGAWQLLSDESSASERRVAGALTESVYGCTVKPHPPWVSGGYAYANTYVTCSVRRTVVVNFQIWENDPTGNPDDAVSSLWSGTDTTIEAGQTIRFGPAKGYCRNFDPTGAEELYNKAKVNVGGVNSSWAISSQVSVTC